MATKKKTRKKSKSKKTVTCGKCKEPGHNARTCPTKVAQETKTNVEATLVQPSTEKPRPPVMQRTVDMREAEAEERRKSTVPTRNAPTATRSGSEAPPYRCPKCNAVDIIVIVRVKDWAKSSLLGKDVFMGETRCASCMNKPSPAELILKWGARPKETIPTDEIPGNA